MDRLVHGEEMAARQQARWDAWELVEDHTREQVGQAYRASLTARGIHTDPQRAIDLAVARLVDGQAVAFATAHLAAVADSAGTRRRALPAPLPRHVRIRWRARAAVRARAGGLTQGQVRAALAAEYTARGMGDINAVDLTVDTNRIRRPSRSDRRAAWAGLARDARSVVHAVRAAPRVDTTDEQAMRRLLTEGSP